MLGAGDIVVNKNSDIIFLDGTCQDDSRVVITTVDLTVPQDSYQLQLLHHHHMAGLPKVIQALWTQQLPREMAILVYQKPVAGSSAQWLVSAMQSASFLHAVESIPIHFLWSCSLRTDPQQLNLFSNQKGTVSQKLTFPKSRCRIKVAVHKFCFGLTHDNAIASTGKLLWS